MHSLAAGLVFAAMSLHSVVAATGTTSGDALDAGLPDDARETSPAPPPATADPTATARVAPPRVAPERTLSPNPLWGIPLTQLSGTRERPIFSPSRRPPPAPTVAVEEPPASAPPPIKEVEPPPLSLVGTIASDDASYGIFLDQSTRAALRLKVGEDYQGWRLRTIQGREVTIEKDQHAVTLALPEPGAASNGDARMSPVAAMPAE
jgi:hypothetical protein